MNFREEFNLSIRARCAVLYVTTREEERLLSVVKDCAAELENMRVVSWDFASGFDVGGATPLPFWISSPKNPPIPPFSMSSRISTVSWRTIWSAAW